MDCNPIFFTWNFPCQEVYVTGDFNNFALTQLHGATQKVAVFWTQLKEVQFRFLVDGDYLHKDSEATIVEDGIVWNTFKVKQVSDSVRFLGSLSIEELEELDSKFTNSNEGVKKISDFCGEEKTEEANIKVKENLGIRFFFGVAKSWFLTFLSRQKIFAMKESERVLKREIVKKRYTKRYNKRNNMKLNFEEEIDERKEESYFYEERKKLREAAVII